MGINRLTRNGLYLLPWLPLFLLSAFVYLSIKPRQYRITVAMELLPDGAAAATKAPPPSPPLVISEIQPLGWLFLCVIVAFIVGLALLICGLVQRSRHRRLERSIA